MTFPSIEVTEVVKHSTPPESLLYSDSEGVNSARVSTEQQDLVV